MAARHSLTVFTVKQAVTPGRAGLFNRYGSPLFRIAKVG